MEKQELRQLYLVLMKNCLSGMLYEDKPMSLMGISGYTASPTIGFVRKLREFGRDAPTNAHTVIGLRRLDNLQACIESVLAENIPGDLIETGVWRGGATIMMRAVLKAYGVKNRSVWVADSFEGLPVPDMENYPQDEMWIKTASWLAVPLQTVKDNFAVYGLLDEQVRFLQGWFRDTLPVAPIPELAILRLDGDLYESTDIALRYLYPKLNMGGFVIVDDYNWKSCRQAVHDYREQHNIIEKIVDIDGFGAYWRREHTNE